MTIEVEPTGHEIGGTLLDLSEGGAMLMIPEVVEVGHFVHLTFEVEPGNFCEATGRVTRAKPGSTGLALGITWGFGNPAFVNFMRNLRAADQDERARYIADLRNIRCIVR